jgi:transmembrane sensor
MKRDGRSKLNTQIYEEACEWFVECRAGDLDDGARREFDSWLRKSPEHLSAYLEIAAIWNEGPALDPEAKWHIGLLTAQAGQDTDNVIALPRTPEDPAGQTALREATPVRRLGPTQRRVFAVAASLVACAVIVGGFQLMERWGVPTVATTVGEQRSILLADGSTVELNSRSKVKVRYSEHERAIDLVEGQALFHVAKDPARPFVVNSGSTRVQAVGTQFDVYRKHDGTVVTVVEGRVAVLAGEAVKLPSAQLAETLYPKVPHASEPELEAGAILLSAGEQATVTRKTVQRQAHPNLTSATAWRQRQIVFDSASLAEVAEEFNRYNQRQFIIDDAELDDFHISGVFSSTDPSSLIRFLRERPNLRVIETASEIRVARNNPERRVTDL